eukprot:2034216-Lingulodinium_polyedra.AAC.1
MAWLPGTGRTRLGGPRRGGSASARATCHRATSPPPARRTTEPVPPSALWWSRACCSPAPPSWPSCAAPCLWAPVQHPCKGPRTGARTT